MSSHNNSNDTHNKNGNNRDLVIRIPQVAVLILVIVGLVVTLVIGPKIPGWIDDLKDYSESTVTTSEIANNPTLVNRAVSTETLPSTPSALPVATETSTVQETPVLTETGTNSPSVNLSAAITISPTSTETMPCKIRIIQNELLVRDGPGTGYDPSWERLVNPSVNSGEEFIVSGISTDRAWVKIIIGDAVGWVARWGTEDVADTNCGDVDILNVPILNEVTPIPTNIPQPIAPTVTPHPIDPPQYTDIPTLPPVVTTVAPVVVTTPAPQQPSANLGDWCASQYGSTDGGFHNISYQGGRCYGVSDVDGDTYSIGVNHDAVCQSVAGSNSHMDRVEGSTLYCTIP